MAETYQVITKVWIAPGCIVCDSCENDCPEVFDVQEETCVIRPPAMSADFLKPLTPSIIVAAEGCPVEVIKFDTVEVEGKAPWADAPAGEPAAGGVVAQAKAPAAKVAAPPAPPDPKWQALLSTSKISPSMSANLGTTLRRAPEINQADEFARAARIEGIDLRNAPPDQRIAMLAAGGAYVPKPSMSDRIRAAVGASKVSRRGFNVALAVGWGLLAFTTLTFGAMFQAFFGPVLLKEPKKLIRVGRLPDFSNSNTVYEQFKPQGIWLVNLQPSENKLIALSTTCTHLGCIPNWLGDRFKCPCHGSGYYITGVNFEGPTPRPLERYSMRIEDGYVFVDKSKVFRSELGEWDNPESFLSLV
jgi:cytochrome b6-f complex iron-sulfur subunit